jgi:hypothetical protein
MGLLKAIGALAAVIVLIILLAFGIFLLPNNSESAGYSFGSGACGSVPGKQQDLCKAYQARGIDPLAPQTGDAPDAIIPVTPPICRDC